jgi:hypothetical protein
MSWDTLFLRLWPSCRTEFPFSYTFFFHISHDLLASYNWPALFIQFLRIFFTGAPWPSVGAPGRPLEHWSTFFFQRVPPCRQLEHLFPQVSPLISSFFFTIVAPVLLLFSLLLATMPHGSHSVTTSLDCVGSPTVAVLCESDCPSSACVVQ